MVSKSDPKNQLIITYSLKTDDSAKRVSEQRSLCWAPKSCSFIPLITDQAPISQDCFKCEVELQAAGQPTYQTPENEQMHSSDRQVDKGDCKQSQHISVHTYSGTVLSEYGRYINVPLTECLMI